MLFPNVILLTVHYCHGLKSDERLYSKVLLRSFFVSVIAVIPVGTLKCLKDGVGTLKCLIDGGGCRNKWEGLNFQNFLISREVGISGVEDRDKKVFY